MFKVGEPISWSINIEPSYKKTFQLGTMYHLKYIESFHNDKEILLAARAARDLMSQHHLFAGNIKVIENDENIEIHLSIIGEKQLIMDMMVGEFLICSTLGKQTLQEILIKLAITSFDNMGDYEKDTITN